MVVIRLARGGAKKRPFYHIVVADQRRALTGRYIEDLGYFNPIAKGQEIRLKLDLAKVESWIAKGAQLSDRVANLVKEQKKEAQKAQAAE
ncbi:MAG: 30S ribosomal protein S16 [Succinivibrionaceae bacterium]